MKKLNYLLMMLLMVSVFCFQAQKASALDEVKFEFYYQSIEDVKTINEPINEDDSLWSKIKKTVKKGTNWVKKGWENIVTRNLAPGEGEKTWYSKSDPNLAYTVNRVKVTTEEELLKAMGVKSESEIKSDGQKALLAAFRQAKSDAIKSRAKDSILPVVKIFLTDTTGYDDAKKYPHVRNDFWPYSSGLAINISSNGYNYAKGPEDAASTIVHEYAHCMDLTFKEIKNPYGLDGSHYGNEITGKRAAFVEAWAEYNEMIESEREVQNIINNTKVLCEESKTVSGEYTHILPEDATSNQLLRSEAYLAYLLYRLTTETENGKEKVFEAFTSTRWNVLRDMSTLVKKFVKQNPEDTQTVCKIVDQVFLGKLSDEELLDMVGKNETTLAYIESRHQEDKNDETGDIEASSENSDVKISKDKVKIKNPSKNPFKINKK